MTSTPATAYDEIMALFRTAWVDGNGDAYKTVYTNVKGDIPTDPEPWARPTMQHLVGAGQTLTETGSIRRYFRQGVLIVQVFVPAGAGLSQGYPLCKMVLDAYEGQSTASGVWFRNGRIDEIGPDGEFYQLNVLINFEYDEAK